MEIKFFNNFDEDNFTIELLPSLELRMVNYHNKKYYELYIFFLFWGISFSSKGYYE